MPQFYYEKTQFLMAASMAAAGANVVLNFIFIRLFGYIAAGYTTLACYMLYSVGHYIVSKRILVNEGIQENLMSPGFLVACSAFPVQDPALRDSARKCRAGLLEERTSAEDDGGYPEKIKKWGRI